MATFDIRTLILVAHIAAIVMALFFGWFSSRERSRHLVFWTLGFVVKALAFMFIYERGNLPRWLSFALANTLIVVSLQLFQAGVAALHDRPMRWALALVSDALILAGLILVERVAGYRMFVIALSLFIAMADAMVIQTLLDRIPKGMAHVQTVAASIFGADILLLLLRIVVMLGGDRLHMDSVLLTALIFLKEILCCMLLGMAFLSMIYWHGHLKKLALIEDLEYALARVNTLQGLLPICAWCKKIRDEKGDWQQLEEYVSRRTDAEFSHGICPECKVRMDETLKKTD